MGVLDELQEKLNGGTQEVVVETPLTPGGGAMDRLAEKLARQEAQKKLTGGFYVNEDDLGMEPVPSPKRDDQGRLIPPKVGPEFYKRFGGQPYDAAAVEAERAARIRASTAGPTIGPATQKQMDTSTLMDPNMTWGTLAGRREMEEETYDAGKLQILSQFIDRAMGSVAGGQQRTASALAKMADTISRITGLSKGGLFDNWARDSQFYKDYFNARADAQRRYSEPKKAGSVPEAIGGLLEKGLDTATGLGGRGLPETGKIAADIAGSLAWDLPQIIAMGPYGLAVHGAAYGLAEGGLEGMVAGGIQGALTHGVFRGISFLPSLWQAPAAAMIGMGTTALETDDPRQILANGASWAILQGQGGHGDRTVKQFIAENPIIGELQQGGRNIKGEKAARRLARGGTISREELILRFPEMKAHMNDRMAEGLLQSLNPDIDVQALRDAGGALKVMEWTLGPMRHQYRLAYDMVRNRIGMPSEKVANAIQHFAEKMDDTTLQQNHYMAKVQIKEGAPEVSYWNESILRGELERRGLSPIISGEEYVLDKYGPQGWDEIQGHPALQQQALDTVTDIVNRKGWIGGKQVTKDEVTALLNKRGILTGEAAANAETDPDPSRGPINPAILKNMYNAELQKLLGLQPMATAQQWADFFQARGVPRGASLGEPVDSKTLAQLYLGTGKSRGYTTPAGYIMVPAPDGHPRANSRGLIPWHQLVMESQIGRTLGPDEVVHHKNHRPYDNSPENLEIMDRAAHIRHHKSAEGRAIDEQIYMDEMAKGPETAYRIENFDTMELRQSTKDEPVGPREFKVSVQKPRAGRPITEFVEAGDELAGWEVRQASKGRVQGGPESEPPLSFGFPDGSKFMGLERFKVERNGDVTMIGHMMDADGQYFTKEVARLTPEEAARYRSGEDFGKLIDDVVERAYMESHKGGGVAVKDLKPGELALADANKISEKITKLEAKLEEVKGGKGWDRDQYKYTGQKRADIEDEIEALRQELKTGKRQAPKPKNEPGWELERVRPPYSSTPAHPEAEPGPGEVLTKDGEVVKKGPGVTRRILDETRWPAKEEPPRGVEKFDEDLMLHDDFKAREQLTVRDVFDGHKENGASTVNIYEGDMAGSDMWAVSLYPERTYRKEGKDLSKKEIYNFIRKNADLLSSDPRLNVGTWFNEEDGHTYMDVTLLLPKDQAAKAEELGRKYNQISITLLDSDFTFPSVKTGGTGKPLKRAGWLPEGERLDDLFATGEMKDIYHFGNAPDVTPHAMGRGAIGEEGKQFYKGYRGTDMLKQGYYLKSNFYTPETSNVEAHLWGGKGVGKGQIDMGQLFNAEKDFNPELDLTLDQQAVRAGKRGWYDPNTNQVRLFTPNQVKYLGEFRGPVKKAIRGSEIEKYLVRDNESLTSGPEDPPEDYSVSEVFGGKGILGNQRGSIGPISAQETADTINRLRFLLFDKFHPVHQLMKMMEDAGIDVPIMKDPSKMVKLLGGLTGKGDAKVFYKRFTIDNDGNITFHGKSLKDIYAPHKGDMAGFDDWLWARAEREEHRLNQRRPADEQVTLELSPQEAERIYQAGRARYGQSGKEFTDFFHGLLDELADSGLMKAQDVAQLKALRPDYAPLRKDLDDLAAKLDAATGTNSARQTLDRVKTPIKTRRGTEKAYTRIPPTQAAVLMTYEITSAVERNKAARAIVELRDLSPEMARIITPTRPKITYVRDIETGNEVKTIGRQEADTIAVSIDGQRHFYKVPQDLADSMKLIYETGLGRWTKLMAVPARTLRTGATAAPEFAFRNPLRDWLTAYMNAKKGFNPLIDFPKGLFQLVFKEKGPQKMYKMMKTDPEAYWKWKAGGGEWSMLVSLDKALGEQAVKQMHKETDTGLKAMRKYIKTPLGYLEAVSEAGEKPTRIGVFERARRKGLSDVEAAVESREASTDFAVRGAETKALSALYTFLNARAQTTMKLGKTAVENPVKFAIKGMAAAGIPSILLYAINRNDPDYWKRDQMERDLYWFLPIDIAGRQVKIPKGEIGLIFGTAVEKVLTYLDHEGVLPEGTGERPPLNPKVTDFLEEVFQNMSPIGNWGETLPTFARPIAEWVNNKSYYYGTPLESEADKGVAPYLRYKPGTSELMKELGKGLGVFNKGRGVSPIMLENTLRGYTGGVGRHALRAADVVADKVGITDRGARPSDPMNVPGAAGFVSRRASGFESEPAKVFYEVAGRIDETKKTLDELLKDKSRAKEVLTWIERHPQEMALLGLTKQADRETGKTSDMFNDVKRQLADLRKQMNLISENKSLSADQKRQALDFLDKKVSTLVDPMWRLINAVSQTPSKK